MIIAVHRSAIERMEEKTLSYTVSVGFVIRKVVQQPEKNKLGNRVCWRMKPLRRLVPDEKVWKEMIDMDKRSQCVPVFTYTLLDLRLHILNQHKVGL